MNEENEKQTPGSDDDVYAGQPIERDQPAGDSSADRASDDGAQQPEMKTAELALPYFDPVNDMAYFLNDRPHYLDALAGLAMGLHRAADDLLAVKDLLAGHYAAVSIEDGAILVQAPAAVIDNAISRGLLGQWPRADDEGEAQDDANAAPEVIRDNSAEGRGDGMKVGRLTLQYTVPGEDLRSYIELNSSLSEALTFHAAAMDVAARRLRQFKTALDGRHVAIEIRGFDIYVHGPDDVIDDLTEKGAIDESQSSDVTGREAANAILPTEPFPHLVECGDHKMAPCVLVCAHIIDHTALAIVPLPRETGSEVENDWLCTRCFEQYQVEFDLSQNHIRPICIHCARPLLREFRRARIR